MIDYKKYDIGMSYYSDRLELANKLGFNFVSEAIDKLYSNGECLRVVGEKLDYNKYAVKFHLKKMGRNLRGRGGSQNRNKTGVAGVCWMKQSSRWYVFYNLNKKQIYLGLYTDFNEAVKVRRQAEIKYGYKLKSSAEDYLRNNIN
jgi:hypothetical protein